MYFPPLRPIAIATLAVLSLTLFTLTSQAEEPQGKAAAAVAAPEKLPELFSGAKNVVFLGDSITYGGRYIEIIEGVVRTKFYDLDLDFINVGLPSETVSGLSEPGHAGGKFPRPDVHERLVRMFDKLHPDVVFACYGMNCGIYHPLGEERFKAYREKMQLLHDIATQQGAQIVHLTPPPFDPQPLAGKTLPAGLEEYRQPFEGYDSVLEAYSKWLLSKRDEGWTVIDLHGPMNDYLKQQRKQDPKFVLAGDGVHHGATGQWLMAKQVLMTLFPSDKDIAAAASLEVLMPAGTTNAKLLDLVAQRQRVRKDAWLTEIGHLRPGMNPGKSVKEAEAEAAAIEASIRKLSISSAP